MKIGIDAKWYFEGPPSGKRVIRALVDHLIEQDRKNEYWIFLNAKHKDQPFPAGQNKNVNLCYVWAGNNMLSNVFILPFYASKFKLDVTLYQNFITLFGHGKKVAYIHDALFLSNPEYYTIYERVYLSPLKFLTRKADAVITVSEIEKHRLLEFKFADNEKMISVAHHGVEKNFRPKEQHSVSDIERIKTQFNLPDRFLLYVGRLNLRKNVDNLLRAIPILRDKSIPLVIVGADNWMKSNHATIIDELGISNRVLFTGAIYKDLDIVYSISTVFCFPSYAESFGLPPLEAMASGVPVVVSNTTSLPEVCGEAGNYVDPAKPEEIAAAIDALLSDSVLYQTKKELGLMQAAKFTWSDAAFKVLQCLENCK
ncbi:MAG: glycosyltransferase family 4 protein [Cyclobacteriaceae bacterium]|nr:glycosyltransferase family 4 protein [Cyclobacteriaceae bacterium]